MSLIPTTLSASFYLLRLYNITMSCSPEIFGANPANVKWQVVRGDTASIRIEFFENDEVTPFDTSDWEFASTTYDFRGDVLDELDVVPGPGYVDVTAPADITEFWGVGYSSTATELAFDVQVVIDDRVWTPVIGTITVLSDVTSGSL
jgi:hypothetical protein